MVEKVRKVDYEPPLDPEYAQKPHVAYAINLAREINPSLRVFIFIPTRIGYFITKPEFEALQERLGKYLAMRAEGEYECDQYKTSRVFGRYLGKIAAMKFHVDSFGLYGTHMTLLSSFGESGSKLSEIIRNHPGMDERLKKFEELAKDKSEQDKIEVVKAGFGKLVEFDEWYGNMLDSFQKNPETTVKSLIDLVRQIYKELEEEESKLPEGDWKDIKS